MRNRLTPWPVTRLADTNFNDEISQKNIQTLERELTKYKWRITSDF